MATQKRLKSREGGIYKTHPPGLLSLRVAQAVIKQIMADNSRTRHSIFAEPEP